MKQKSEYKNLMGNCYNKSMKQGEEQNFNNKILRNTEISIRERPDSETVELVLNEGQYVISIPRANWVSFMYKCVAWTDSKIYQWAREKVTEEDKEKVPKKNRSFIIDDPGGNLFDARKQWELK